MNYQDTVNWMFNQLPMYQNKGKSAYKADLSNTINLAAHLNNPENNFKSIHVAGTNGKGSTSHMIASILQEAGYNVGLYTSPHLKDFRERIKLNGKLISKQFVIQFIKKHKSFFELNCLSFFEMTVGMAFDYFSKKQVDIAVIEVGLGGRLDSTNIISPEISVITNIGMDHTQFLGSTIDSIANEKGGIIKSSTPVVIGQTQNSTKEVFKAIAKEKNAPIVFADKEKIGAVFSSDLKGKFQLANIHTAVVTIRELWSYGFNVTDLDVKKGLMNIVMNTGLFGRWQVLQENPKIICDTAHNKEGLQLVLKELLAMKYSNIHFVIGFVNDKNLSGIIDLFPVNASYYFCKPNIQRGLNVFELKSKFEKIGLEGKTFDSVKIALNSAVKNAHENDLIYVGGSTFVVAEIL
jgi:dihydrofolate synthase/folylpolyglutamate synthase